MYVLLIIHKYRKLEKKRWQRNVLQMEEQDKNPQTQLNEEEMGQPNPASPYGERRARG